MDIILRILGGLLCLTIAFAVQAAFVWAAAKIVMLDCKFKEAAVIAMICAALLMIPKAGLLLSCIAFFVLFVKWLRAGIPAAVLAFLINCILELLLLGAGVA